MHLKKYLCHLFASNEHVEFYLLTKKTSIFFMHKVL